MFDMPPFPDDFSKRPNRITSAAGVYFPGESVERRGRDEDMLSGASSSCSAAFRNLSPSLPAASIDMCSRGVIADDLLRRGEGEDAGDSLMAGTAIVSELVRLLYDEANMMKSQDV
jgi:hypothetical protein